MLASLVGLALTLTAQNDHSAPPACDRAVAADYERLLAPFARADALRGTVRIECGDRVVFERAYGLAVEDWDVSNTAATRYMIGSISKTLNAAVLLRLDETGQIDLDTPLDVIDPVFAREDGARITLRQLINHTSGLPGIFDRTRSLADFAADYPGRSERNRAFAQYVSGLDLSAPPGETFAYSNTGAMLSAVAIETALNRPYDDILREYVITPLAVDEIGLLDERHPVERLANGYAPGRNGPLNAPHVEWRHSLAIGNAYATAEELIDFARGFLGGELIAPEIIETHIAQPSGGYPYGWHYSEAELNEQTQLARFAASGSTRGFSAELHHYPDAELSIAITANTGGMYYGPLAETLAQASLGLDTMPIEPPLLRQFLAQTESADRFLDQLTETPETDLTAYQFGYELIRANFGHDAIAVFEWLASRLPQEADVWVGLGDAQRRTGNTEAARQAYQHALDVQPGHSAAMNRLSDE